MQTPRWPTSSSVPTAATGCTASDRNAGFRARPEGLPEVRVRLPVRAARRLLPRAGRRVLRLRPGRQRDRLRARLLRADRARRREGHRPPRGRGARAAASRTATTRSRPSSSGGSASSASRSRSTPRATCRRTATADLFPAYDDDGGLLLVLTPVPLGSPTLSHDRSPPQPPDPPPRRRPPGGLGSPSWRRRTRKPASTSRAASSLVYQAKPTIYSRGHRRGDPALDRHHARARRPARRRRARDRTRGRRPDRRPAARRKNVAGRDQPGRHDRPAVLLRLGDERPRPGLQARAADAAVTGGPAAGNPGPGRSTTTTRSCGRRRCPATNGRQRHPQGSLLRVDDKSKRVRCGPQEPRPRPRRARRKPAARCCASARRSASASRASSRSSAGRSCCRPRSPTATATRRSGCGRLRRTPTSSSRTTPRCAAPTSRTPSRTSTRAPVAPASRTSRSSSRAAGAKKWQEVTREIAQRGQQQFLPGQDVLEAVQHFAIVLDDELISAPVHRLQAEPRRHRRPQRLGDLGRLHDQVGPAAWRTCSRPARCRSSSS